MTSPAANAALLAWFEPRRAAYPWRRSRDPYAIWVSEVMLQQTQARRVVGHLERFLGRYPTVPALAAAPRGDVLRAWDGLGYNRRAIALADGAREVVARHDGRVPEDPAVLRGLPGVGPYTAAAIASIAFGLRVAAVDTNVRRVVSRVWEGVEPQDLAPRRVLEIAARRIDAGDPGAWNQAMMDVGREHCRPRPRCDGCPLAARCRFRRSGAAAAPHRRPERGTERFEGSRRQLRGAIVRELRREGSSSLGALVDSLPFEPASVLAAVAALAAEGVVRAGHAALAGSRRGVVRLPD